MFQSKQEEKAYEWLVIHFADYASDKIAARLEAKKNSNLPFDKQIQQHMEMI